LRRLLKLGPCFCRRCSEPCSAIFNSCYLATHGAKVDYRGAGESQAFAAALADYIIPPTTHFLWGGEIGRLWRSGPNGLWQSEWQLYLGRSRLASRGAGVFHPRHHVVVALIAMALGCLLLSFGPGLYLTHPPPLNPNTNDVQLSAIPAPGRLLLQLPGFNNLRAWARLGFFVELSIGLLAAAGLARLINWLKDRLRTPAVVQAGVAAVCHRGWSWSISFHTTGSNEFCRAAPCLMSGFRSNTAILHLWSTRYRGTASGALPFTPQVRTGKEE
jgi:hypothetical protein